MVGAAEHCLHDEQYVIGVVDSEVKRKESSYKRVKEAVSVVNEFPFSTCPTDNHRTHTHRVLRGEELSTKGTAPSVGLLACVLTRQYEHLVKGL